MSSDSTFNDMWAPTWEVQKTIPGARACILENTDRTYKSGRQVVDVLFFDGSRREICRRSGMRLTSKKGAEYVVCRRNAEQTCRREPEVTRSVAADAQLARNATAAAQFDASDVFE
jgi:hypothetical protein